MNDYMDKYKRLSRPPQTALKLIQAGRLKGKSDINPQWRIEAFTQEYGQCGTGWKFEIENLWNAPGPDDQVFAFAKIQLYVYIADSGWSSPVPGIGGSMLVAKETAKLHANDEAFKMAVTDALGTAMKFFGVAADIYMGLWDGSKYKDREVIKETDKKIADKLIESLQETKSIPHKDNWKKKHADEINALNDVNRARVIKAGEEHTKKLKEAFKNKQSESIFDRLAGEEIGTPNAMLDEFIELTAKARDITVNEFKHDAGKDFERFCVAFESWKEKFLSEGNPNGYLKKGKDGKIISFYEKENLPASEYKIGTSDTELN